MNKTIKIKDIISSINPKLKDILRIYNGLTLQKLSFNNNIENIKFYNDYKLKEEVAYFNLTDKDKYSFTAIIKKSDFLKSKTEYELDKSKLIDGIIYDLKIDKNSKIVIYLKNIKEAGLSELELEKRKIRKYCIDNNYFNLRNKKLKGFINRIALITSSNGNTESDILKQLGLDLNNNINKIDIFKAKKYEDFSYLIREINKTNNYQILVLFRGGNEDKYMIHFSKIPVIEEIIKSKIITASAIGHQSDHPIIQDIVDIGYDTPSSFAKSINKHNKEIINDLYLENENKNKIIKNIVQSLKNNLNNVHNLLNKNIYNILKNKEKENLKIYNEINLKIDNLINKKNNYETIKKQKRNFKIILIFVFILLFFILYLIINT